MNQYGNYGVSPGAVGRRPARGFTLLELLIALSLISLILVMLFSGLRLGSRTWDSLERHVSESEDVRLARGFLQRSLLQARNIPWARDNERMDAFYGTSEQIEFIAPLSSYVGTAGLYVLRVAAVNRNEKKVLIVQRWLFHPEVLDGAGAVPEWRPLASPGAFWDKDDAPMGIHGTSVLMENLGELEFSFFGLPARGGREPAWYDEWKDRRQIPQLVKIRLNPENGEWADLVVPLVDS